MTPNDLARLILGGVIVLSGPCAAAATLPTQPQTAAPTPAATVTPTTTPDTANQAKPASKPRAKRVPIQPHAMPFDSRLVVFPYDANYTYPIPCKVDAFTHIQLAEGEHVVGMYLSDTLRWVLKVAVTKQDIFVKPTGADQDTVATLITNRRRYQLSFSTRSSENWYQRVSWEVTEGFEEGETEVSIPTARRAPVTPFVDRRDDAGDGAGGDGEARSSFRGAASEGGSPVVQLDKLNFNYGIEGDAPFRPTMVFDDGRFTWIKMPKTQDLPALFAIGPTGDAEVTNFLPPRGDYYQVPRVLIHGAVLKLGKAEIRIRNLQDSCGGFFQPKCLTTSNLTGQGN